MKPSSISTIESSSKLEAVQFLRGLAAILVLVEHVLREAIERFSYNYEFFHFPWAIGINLFFVISGFIMYYTNHDAFAVPGAPAKFLLRRVIRVVPLYFLFTSAMVAVLLVIPGALGKTRFDLQHVISSYLFWPVERYDGRTCPILSLGWTLNYEMFFYLLFAAVLFLKRGTGVVLLGVGMVALVLAGKLLGIPTVALRFWTSEIILEFLIGVGIGVYYVGLKNIQTRWFPFWIVNTAAILIAATAGSLNAHQEVVPRIIERSVPAALVVFAFVALLSPAHGAGLPSWTSALGNSSYALYLSHRFPLRLLTLAWSHIMPFNAVSGIVFMVVSFFVCIGVGQAVHLWVESPLLNGVNALVRRRIAQGTVKSPVVRAAGQ